MMNGMDAVVVGAGPVGLLTAIELTLGGARVAVLERLSSPSKALKAMAIGPLGAEALMRRGMAASIAARDGQGPRKFSGHFAGLSLIRSDAQKEPERRMRAVDQQGIEAMLIERSRSLGIEVRRECEVDGFTQRNDGVDVEWTTPTSAGQTSCSYLVGCDGGRSIIRKMAGFEFPGSPPTLTFYQAVVDLDRPELLLPIGWNRTPGGVFSYGRIADRLLMLDFNGPPENRDAPVTREEVESVLRRISGTDVCVKTLESGSRWTDNTRLVDTYRRGRVLLAGDAAHVHSPFGGQGLSLGLVDAANLGWKLAAVVRAEMPESMLDTYTTERRPVAEAVLANTLAQVAIMRPDPQSGAMREIVANLMQFDDANRLIGEMMSGLSTRYDLGSERDDVGRLIGDKTIRHGDAEVSLYDVMQNGMGVLLDASTDRKASEFVASTTRKIRRVAVNKGPSLLIRPDACVAWAGEGNDMDGLEPALRRWFEH